MVVHRFVAESGCLLNAEICNLARPDRAWNDGPQFFPFSERSDHRMDTPSRMEVRWAEAKRNLVAEEAEDDACVSRPKSSWTVLRTTISAAISMRSVRLSTVEKEQIPDIAKSGAQSYGRATLLR